MSDALTVIRPNRAPRLEVERVRGRLTAKLYGIAGDAPRLAHYEVVDRIGSGAHGDVYLVHDPRLGRRLAIKVLRRAVDRDGTTEARALAQVVHPNVVPVFDVGVAADTIDEDPRPYIAMEFVEGRTLLAWCDDAPAWTQRLRVLIDAGRGLQAVHAAGLVHGDFKPANVVVGNDGRPRVTDFGLARCLPDATTIRDSVTGRIGGTPGYRAPECEAGSVDARSDQYSFCATAWRLLMELPTVTRPHGRHVARVRSILARGLEERPEDRWPDLGALLDRLVEVGTASRRVQRATIAGGLGAIALLGTLAVAAARGDREPPAAVASPGVGGVHAQLLLLEGHASWRAGKIEEARATFERAVHVADGQGDDRAAVRAILQLLEMLGIQRTEFAEARRWESHARAAVTRLGDSELEAALDLRWGAILARAGEPASGRDVLLALRERLIESPSRERVRVADVDSELAQVEMGAGRSADAVRWAERAVEGQAAEVGKEHPRYTTALLRLGAAQEQRSDLAGARRSLEEALAIDERSSRDTITVRNSLAIVLERQGELEGAARQYEIALASEGLSEEEAIALRTNLGALALLRAAPEAAYEHFTVARTLAESHFPANHRVFASIHQGLGISHARRGDFAGAVASFERSVEVAVELEMSAADVGRFRSQLGQARWKTGARTQGHAEVEQARRELATDPTAFAAELADADAWLAAHRRVR